MGFLNSRAARLSGYEQGFLTPVIVVDWLPKEYRYTDPRVTCHFHNVVYSCFALHVSTIVIMVLSHRESTCSEKEYHLFANFLLSRRVFSRGTIISLCTWLFNSIINI